LVGGGEGVMEESSELGAMACTCSSSHAVTTPIFFVESFNTESYAARLIRTFTWRDSFTDSLAVHSRVIQPVTVHGQSPQSNPPVQNSIVKPIFFNVQPAGKTINEKSLRVSQR